MSLQKFRIVFALTLSAFLILCNLAFLYSYSQGKWTEFAQQMDQPSIKFLSLLFFVVIIALAVVKNKSEDIE